MENESKIVVTEFLTAVQQGNIEKSGQLLSPQLVWNQPGKNAISGVKQSSSDVFEMVGAMFELSGNTLRLVEVKSVSANGNKAAALVRWTASKPDGKILDVENIDVYTIENGKIIQAEIFSADIDLENKFWS